MAIEDKDRVRTERRLPAHLVILFVVMFLFYAYFFIGNPTLIFRIGTENGPIEDVGAVCFLAAAVLFFVRYLVKADGLHLRFLKTRRNPIILGLALLFFTCAGEEISWGHVIFHYKTPEFFAKYSAQKEVNIHNLSFFYKDDNEGHRKFYAERIFMLFSGAYMLLIPLLARNKRILACASRLHFPIAPLYTGVFFCLSYGIFKFTTAYVVRAYPDFPKLWYLPDESRESFAAILFVVVAWTILQHARKARRKNPV